MLKPSPETQSNFNNSIKNSFTSSFDFWTTDRRVIDTQLEYQLDIGSSQKTNSPKYLTAALQTSDRSASPNKGNNTAIFDRLDVRKQFAEIDGFRCPCDSVSVNCNTNNYLDQCRNLKLFCREYVGDPL